MKISAPPRERLFGALFIAAAIVYLIPFVSRGWIAHDEGMLGQSAERVLQGALPHVDYEETYTGGLSWLYAAVFRVAGIDLVNVRWTLFIGAIAAICLIYAITRRYLRPANAAIATWIAVLWSFPNYFAGLPSWWLLICALVSLWALLRHSETEKWRYLASAGLAAGIAITIKQTGLYLLAAVVLSALYSGRRHAELARTALWEKAARWALAAGAITSAAVILAPRVFAAEGFYLLMPVVGCALVVLVSGEREHGHQGRSPLMLVSIAVLAAAVPLAFFVIPYVSRHGLAQLVHGALLLPRQRVALINRPMLDVFTAIPLSLPLLGLAYLEFRSRNRRRSVALMLATWFAALILPIYALWSLKGYQIVWQFARAAAALLPAVVACQLLSGRVQDRRKSSALFAAASILAWISINQFPYAGPVYFCYTAPLAVITAIASFDSETTIRRGALRPWTLLLLMFALLSANRVYLGWLGVPAGPPEEEVFSWSRAPERSDARLELGRAHLNVGADDARVYGRLVSSIRAHLNGGQLVAGPDCPEVYFLAGLMNPSGRLYDTFSNRANDDPGPWLTTTTWAFNHGPGSSFERLENVS